MALFLLFCTDRPGARELRAATRPDHLAWIGSLGDAVKLAGPWLDEADGGPLGSMLIVEADDLAAARSLAATDPYATVGLFAQTEVRTWRLAAGGFAKS